MILFLECTSWRNNAKSFIKYDAVVSWLSQNVNLVSLLCINCKRPHSTYVAAGGYVFEHLVLMGQEELLVS